jgi:ParB family chromosome partitioning protein
MTDPETTATPAAPDDRAPVDNHLSAFPAALVHVDPGTLVIEANVRSEVVLDKDFVGSIRDHGVLVPIVAWRAGEELRVRMGQRRALAAVEAGCAWVPVYVIEATDEGKAAEITRIVSQLIENTHRAGLREVEKVRGHQQLALLGLAAGQIARRTRTKVATVKASLRVAGSELAVAAMARYDLTVDQAAALAEFAADAEAVKVLTVTARNRPEQFTHVAQRLRDEAAEAAAREALVGQLTQAGVAMVDHTDYVFGGKIDLVDHLRPTPDAEPGTELSAEDHATCPGHAAFLDTGSRWGSQDRFTAVFVCTDWRANGHARRNAPASMADSGPVTTATAAGPMSAED